MIVTSVGAAPVPVIPQNLVSDTNRTLYVTNNGVSVATLLVDGGPQVALNGSTGIPLAVGATQRFGPTNIGDQDGNQAIYAFSTGGTVISVNAIVSKKTL